MSTSPPEAVLAAARTAIDARRAWKAAPEDRDHAVRHEAADRFDRAMRALNLEVEDWIAAAAAQLTQVNQ